tara:strand:- start:36490 stop:38610 length:2121 start_codon:yes stop_codon:yes gene_type:complete
LERLKGGKYIIATDVGGTCTDTVIFAAGEGLKLGKALSTPPNFADGIINSVYSAAEEIGLSLAELFSSCRLFVHGSTVVDNALLTRTGDRTGLITTKGFEDTLLMTRGAYGRWGGLTEDKIKHPVATDRPEPLVPTDRIEGVSERVDYKGEILLQLDEAAAEISIRSLIEVGKVDAIAVSLLWSFFNPQHEKKIKEIINKVSPGVYVSLSNEIAPVPGEYERTSTTVINAYAGSITKNYLTSLESQLEAEGYNGEILVMQGYGGLLSAREAADRAVGMLECGPAAGVIGSRYLGSLMGEENIIAADMGGTTFKVGVIQDGELSHSREPMVDRFHYVAPKIEVVSIGSGGGSIISLDPRTNIPRIGPISAGAVPGPVCYGQGGDEPTLTDVMLLIGYIDPDRFLGGSIKLDVENTRRVFNKKIAQPLGLDIETAAFGIYRIAAAQVTDLIHEITVEQGLDPRDFVLHAFGGSCPLLCSMFGAELNVKNIVVPYAASVNCAFGLASADIVHEYTHTETCSLPCSAEHINNIFKPMVLKGHSQLLSEGFTDKKISLEWAIDFRYGRQVHEVTTPIKVSVPLDDENMSQLISDFETLYERRYGKGSAYKEAGIEMTMFRLTARGLVERPNVEKSQYSGIDSKDAQIGTRNIFVDAKDGMVEAPIYDFDKLSSGNEITGPAVIHTPITTIVIQLDQVGKMDDLRNILIKSI